MTSDIVRVGVPVDAGHAAAARRQYGVFGAACHYEDGTLVFADSQAMCAPKSPWTGATFLFWHPG